MRIRTYIFIILFSGFLLGIIVITNAGFHGTGLVCNRCHTMHYSEDGGVAAEWDATGPFAHLLIKEHSSVLCLTCHDGTYTDAPNVLNSASTSGAGFFAGVMEYDNSDAPNGHNLGKDETSFNCNFCHQMHGGSIPNFASQRIGCLNCHDPHGWDPGSTNYSYRNLSRGLHFDASPKYKAFVNPDASGLAVYEHSNIGYGAPDEQDPDPLWYEVTNICFKCHLRFSGFGGLSGLETRNPENEDGTCVRHPNTNSHLGAWEAINKHEGGTDPLHWYNGSDTGFSIGRLPFIVSGAFDGDDLANYNAAKTFAQDNEVFCLTCHKAHGSQYDSSMRWNYRESSNLGCQQCHNKGN